MIKILIVDDEKPICDLIDLNLSAAGYFCKSVQDGMKAIELIEKETFDLILLDIMLPGVDGFDIMEYIRPLKIPVIFITAKGDVKDRVKGLRLGAEDYLVKPFDFDELLARVRAMTRKRTPHASSVITIGDLTLDTKTHAVTRGGKSIELSAREYTILEYMCMNPGVVLSREKIEDHIWNYDYSGGSNVVDVYISYLRKKIDADRPALIRTVRGAGYIMREPQ